MEYKGKLYGKVGKGYFPMEQNTDNVDAGTQKLNSQQLLLDSCREALEEFTIQPYPKNIFLPITQKDLAKIHALLKKEMNMPWDRLTGYRGRELRNPIIEKAKEILLIMDKK